MAPENNQQQKSSEDYPGQTLGIIGFALAFVVQLAGLVLSIIALVVSRRSGQSNPFAIAGIITSVAMFVFGCLFVLTLTLFFATLPLLRPVIG